MQISKHLIAAALTTVCAVSAYAQNVTVTDAWARATVQGQKATGAFMKITAKENAKLIAGSSPVKGSRLRLALGLRTWILALCADMTKKTSTTNKEMQHEPKILVRMSISTSLSF